MKTLLSLPWLQEPAAGSFSAPHHKESASSNYIYFLLKQCVQVYLTNFLYAYLHATCSARLILTVHAVLTTPARTTDLCGFLCREIP